MYRGRVLRPPRRLRFHRAGWVVSSSAVGLGVAAIATGNNLLFLMLGAMLGLIALSGALSELTLRGLTLERTVPTGLEAGRPGHLTYRVRNRKRRLPSFAIEAGERRHVGRAFLAQLPPATVAALRVKHVWTRRGVHPLTAVTLSTSFPFGLFRKERDVELPAEVVVWPRTDRRVRAPRPAGERSQPTGALSAGASGARGEYRSLRPYRPGDDPRDVHWRSTARSGEPVVREYAREQARTLRLVLDLRGSEPAAGEEDSAEAGAEETVIEIAAALAARAIRRGEPIALTTPDDRVPAGTGLRHLERVLDVLARARFRPDAPPPSPPAPPPECVLLTARSGAGRGGWGDVYTGADPA